MADLESRFSVTSSYASLARRAYAEVQRIAADRGALAPDPNLSADKEYDRQARLGEVVHAQRENCTLAIAFAALALEAYAYDYGARGISESYVKKIDRGLTLEAKWLLYPRLIASRSFDPGGRTMQLVTALRKARNDLVHFKSRRVDPDTDLTAPAIRQRDSEMLKSAETAIVALDELAEELETLDPSEPARFFLAAQEGAG